MDDRRVGTAVIDENTTETLQSKVPDAPVEHNMVEDMIDPKVLGGVHGSSLFALCTRTTHTPELLKEPVVNHSSPDPTPECPHLTYAHVSNLSI